MKDQQPIRTARRRVAMQNRLGSNAFCLFCGYACLEALTLVTRRWLEERGIAQHQLDRLFEQHHIFGQNHDSEATVTLCLNCHREITEKLAREDVNMRPEKNLHKLIALILRASAVLFDTLAAIYRKWASLLENQSENK